MSCSSFEGLFFRLVLCCLDKDVTKYLYISRLGVNLEQETAYFHQSIFLPAFPMAWVLGQFEFLDLPEHTVCPLQLL